MPALTPGTSEKTPRYLSLSVVEYISDIGKTRKNKSV
jgi:hypothetical protein